MKTKNKFLLFVGLLFLILNINILNVSADDEINTPTPPTEVIEQPSPAPSISLILRANDNVIWQGSVSLQAAGNISITDSNSTSRNINSRSILAVLKSIDDTSDAFSISNLTYYDSFGSFYLKCLSVSGVEFCDNWQYAIGADTPSQSIDQAILSGNESIGIYFGNNHQLSLSTNSTTAGSNLTTTATKYNYLNNSWEPLNGISVGVTVPNPADPWNPKVIATYPADINGTAVIPMNEAGDYKIGIAEDYYFPLYGITVSPSLAGSSSGNAGTQNPSQGSSPKKEFNVDKAIEFISKQQSKDGSFASNDIYTDWVAIAFGSVNKTIDSKDRLLSYLKSSSKKYDLLTDNERRSMALLALGENPYSFNGVNYVETIINSFDGNQFGDKNLINDDVFALVVLQKSGYTIEDDIIKKDIDFIISKQKDNGSWEDSVDVTAAVIQGLKNLDSNKTVADNISKAKEYVKNSQDQDGGWKNAYTTSWALQAMSLLGETLVKNGVSGMDYLSNQQQEDGGVLLRSDTLENRIWATSYAIPAAQNKDWGSILVGVAKPTTQIPNPLVVEPIPNKSVHKSKLVANANKNNRLALPKNDLIIANESAPSFPVNINSNEVDENALDANVQSSGVNRTRILEIVGLIFTLFALLFRKRIAKINMLSLNHDRKR